MGIFDLFSSFSQSVEEPRVGGGGENEMGLGITKFMSSPLQKYKILRHLNFVSIHEYMDLWFDSQVLFVWIISLVYYLSMALI